MKDFFDWLGRTNNELVGMLFVVLVLVTCTVAGLATVAAFFSGWMWHALFLWFAVPAAVLWRIYLEETRRKDK
jgi:uncharacterized membrane protein